MHSQGVLATACSYQYLASLGANHAGKDPREPPRPVYNRSSYRSQDDIYRFIARRPRCWRQLIIGASRGISL